jgi:hypothetical protein
LHASTIIPPPQFVNKKRTAEVALAAHLTVVILRDSAFARKRNTLHVAERVEKLVTADVGGETRRDGVQDRAGLAA